MFICLKKNFKHLSYIYSIFVVKFIKDYFPYKLEFEPRSPEKFKYPKQLDETFFKELLFVRHEQEIVAYLEKRERRRNAKIERAKKNNSFLTCNCCFNDELIDDDMVSCPSQHPFCKECVKRYVSVQIGDSKYTFKCLDERCDKEFALPVIGQLLEPNMFSKMLKNRQCEEIKGAGIDNLEFCPHCDYATIIENANERIFACQNPECLKETCRSCKEPNHLPLRCDEVEKKDEVDMRTSIENRINEAMIRVCYKCKRRFYKEEGCNMMHCTCGAAMCYVCRAPIKDYSHFKPETCPQFSDNDELHKVEMEKAYKEALDEYLEKHPEFRTKEIKNDPKKMLEDLIKKVEEKKKNAAAAAAVAAQNNQNNMQLLNQQQQMQPNQNLVVRPHPLPAVPGVQVHRADLNQQMQQLQQMNVQIQNQLAQLRNQPAPVRNQPAPARNQPALVPPAPVVQAPYMAPVVYHQPIVRQPNVVFHEHPQHVGYNNLPQPNINPNHNNNINYGNLAHQHHHHQHHHHNVPRN